MLHSLTLPPYRTVEKFEGQGNYAVCRYYFWPFRFFYRHKLKMIVKMLEKGKIYRNILDFGAGPAKIFQGELSKHALRVKCVDYKEEIPHNAKFDVIVCASVLEFTDLEKTIDKLCTANARSGMIIVASPLKNWLTTLYFKLIGDKNKRHTRFDIEKALLRYYYILEEKKWLGLYFCLKGSPK